MKSRTLFAVLVAVLSFVAVPAMAAGPYVGAGAGAVFLPESSLTIAGISAGDAKFDTGFGLGLSGGYDFGTYRLEGEFSYRKNDNKEITSGGVTDPLDGDVSSMALMVNGYYDFRTVSQTFVPYLGAGIGFADVSAKIIDPTVGGGTVIDDSDMVFAYQIIAGVGYVVSPKITIDLNYKYFATTDPELEIVGAGGIKGEVEYSSHNIFLGVRYAF